MSSPLIIPAMRLRGSSMASRSATMSRNASIRGPASDNGVCAMVLCSTRSATGWRSR
ncbi:Uncharacterised protein [Mycobacteroides abscessus subsp. abscessus]|nr:Uncharacterised protein [Mycobacteroides abscessus subsp. abscessus]